MKPYNNWLKDKAFGNTWIKYNSLNDFNIEDYVKLILNNKNNKPNKLYNKIIGRIEHIGQSTITIKTKDNEYAEINPNFYDFYGLEYVSNEDYCNYWINKLFDIFDNYSYSYRELIDETEIIIDEKEDKYTYNLILLRENLLKLFYKYSETKIRKIDLRK